MRPPAAYPTRRSGASPVFFMALYVQCNFAADRMRPCAYEPDDGDGNSGDCGSGWHRVCSALCCWMRGDTSRRKYRTSEDEVETGSVSSLVSRTRSQLARVRWRQAVALVLARQSAIRADRARATTECVVCMDAQRSVLLRPCHHVCLCRSCVHVATRDGCPVCRCHVLDSIPVYM